MAQQQTNNDDIPLLDPWTSLSFKRSLGNRHVGGVTFMQPTWVGSHARRLQAYDLLTALNENAGRYYLQAKGHEKDEHREYGDASLITSQVLAALIGDDQHIVSDGAQNLDPENPDAEAQEAVDFQEWMTQLCDTERLGLKIIETERNAVIRGDGVYTVGWSDSKGRPRIRVFDPGFYFPVLEDGNQDDYPSKVHIAWEVTDEDALPGAKRKVRRITWELVETDDPRQYSWNDSPVFQTCLFSDGTWTFDPAGRQTVEDFTEASVTWEVEDGVEQKQVDLFLDFVPVVHIPNTVALLEHFGKSSLSSVAQILDDLANADTDLQAASATTGKPPVALSNATLSGPPTYKAGEVWQLGKDGKLEMLDTSNSLDALLKYVDALLSRLSVNSRLPASVLGRVDASKVASGIALLLSFGPLKSMIQEMRLVRDEKYPLLFKFIHRVAQAGKMPDIPEVYIPTRLEFGRFLPEDVAAVVQQITELLNARAISLETAVRMLIDAGLPIEDAVEEVERIQSRDFGGAESLLAATGDVQVVSDYLGIEVAAPAPTAAPNPNVVPAVQVPPAPGEQVPTPPVNPPVPPAQ